MFLNDLLFEIKCAEEVGYYKLADQLDVRLMKLASVDYALIKKALRKKYENAEVDFYPSLNKFIISFSNELSNSEKRNIQKMAYPYDVAIRSAQYKNIDQLMEDDEFNIEQHHIDQLDKEFPGKDYVSREDIFDREPTDEELLREEQFPAEEFSEEGEKEKKVSIPESDIEEESEMSEDQVFSALKEFLADQGYL